MKGFIKWVVFVGLAMPVVAVVSASYASSFTSSGNSMEPTLHAGDIVIANPLSKKLVPGAIYGITCYNCGDDGVMRGEGLRKRVIRVRAEDRCIWIEGDNKPVSYDSRDYGWVCPRGTAPGKPEYEIDGRIYPLVTVNRWIRSLKERVK